MRDAERLLNCLLDNNGVLLPHEEDLCLCCLDKEQEGAMVVLRTPVTFDGKTYDCCGVLLCMECRAYLEDRFEMLLTHIACLEKKKVE